MTSQFAVTADRGHDPTKHVLGNNSIHIICCCPVPIALGDFSMLYEIPQKTRFITYLPIYLIMTQLLT